jgi:hypothetical protein
VAHAGGEQAVVHPVHRRVDRRQLRDDVRAVPTVLDHLLDASDLALHPAQSPDHIIDQVVGESHDNEAMQSVLDVTEQQLTAVPLPDGVGAE